MALDVTVSKVSVTKPQEGIHVVTMNLLCEDATVEVINENFTGQKRDNISWTETGNRLVEKMQTRIDEYKECATIFNSSQMNTAVTSIQNALVG